MVCQGAGWRLASARRSRWPHIPLPKTLMSIDRTYTTNQWWDTTIDDHLTHAGHRSADNLMARIHGHQATYRYRIECSTRKQADARSIGGVTAPHGTLPRRRRDGPPGCTAVGAGSAVDRPMRMGPEHSAGRSTADPRAHFSVAPSTSVVPIQTHLKSAYSPGIQPISLPFALNQ